MSEFFAMGGHGFYVWGAYAVTFGLLAAEVMLLRRRAHRARTVKYGSETKT
jgi:heme exporter protein D